MCLSVCLRAWLLQAGASTQLPTLILFQKGKETARVPHVYPDGKVAGGKYRRVSSSVGGWVGGWGVLLVDERRIASMFACPDQCCA